MRMSFSSSDLVKYSIPSVAQKMDALQWMGAVRMRVQTADKNISIIYTTPVHQVWIIVMFLSDSHSDGTHSHPLVRHWWNDNDAPHLTSFCSVNDFYMQQRWTIHNKPKRTFYLGKCVALRFAFALFISRLPLSVSDVWQKAFVKLHMYTIWAIKAWWIKFDTQQKNE